tara:strand:+ start:4446 stop:4784 length:339 start_codon:yes stop_codon:yes gene_type:complete
MELQDNKVIAEFMGYKHIPDSSDNFEHYIKEGTIVFPYKIKYYSDWNELMAVVERIENCGFEFFIVESRCKIAHNTDQSIETVIDFEIIGSKIEATYQSVVEFINWYNLELK